MLDAYERAKSKIAKGIPLPDLEADYPGTAADSYTAVEIDRIERDGRDLFRFRLNDSGFIAAEAERPADSLGVVEASDLAKAMLATRPD